MFLPFHADMLASLANAEKSWTPYYKMKFLGANEAHRHWLWDATKSICPETMQKIFQKAPDQEETYCKVPWTEIKASNPPKDSITWALLCPLSPKHMESLRFIELKLY